MNNAFENMFRKSMKLFHKRRATDVLSESNGSCKNDGTTIYQNPLDAHI